MFHRRNQKSSTCLGTTGVVSLSRARNGQCAVVGDDGRVQVVSPDFQEVSVLPIGAPSGFAPGQQDDPSCAAVTCTCWSPDGMRLGCGLNNGWVLIWNIKLQCVDYLWQAHEVSVYTLSWAPDASALVSLGHDLELGAWERNGSKRFICSHNDGLGLSRPFTLAWSPDGRYFAVACMDATVRLITAANGQEVRRCQCTDMPCDLIWLDRQIRILLEDHSIACWNYAATSTPHAIWPLETAYVSSPAAITASAWAADGTSLACIYGKRGRIWRNLNRAGVPMWEGEVGEVNALVYGRGAEVLLGGPAGIQVLSLTEKVPEASAVLHS